MRCWHRVAYSARGNLSDTTGLVFPASFFYAACGREDVALSECAPFVRKRRVRGPSDVAGRLRNACRSCPGGSLRAIRPRFGIPDNTRRRTHAAHVLHVKNGLSGFWRKKLSEPGLAGGRTTLSGFHRATGRFASARPIGFRVSSILILARVVETVRTRRSVPYAGGGELLLSGCQRRLRTVFPAEKRSFSGFEREAGTGA